MTDLLYPSVKRELLQRTTDRSTRMLTLLITAHRAGTLTNETARAGIAVLSELRSMAEDLEREIKALQHAEAEPLTGRPAG